jgi:hypothetical protein
MLGNVSTTPPAFLLVAFILSAVANSAACPVFKNMSHSVRSPSTVAQVQQDLFLSLAEQIFDSVAQHRDVFALFDSSTQVNNGDAIYLPGACFHAHVEGPGGVGAA